MELRDGVVLTRGEGESLHKAYMDIFYASPCSIVRCDGRYSCTDCPFKTVQDAYHKYVGALGNLLDKAEVEIK